MHLLSCTRLHLQPLKGQGNLHDNGVVGPVCCSKVKETTNSGSFVISDDARRSHCNSHASNLKCSEARRRKMRRTNFVPRRDLPQMTWPLGKRAADGREWSVSSYTRKLFAGWERNFRYLSSTATR